MSTTRITRLIAILASIFLVLGCGDNFIQPYMYERAQKVCEPNDGLLTIRVDGVNVDRDHWIEGQCRNGVEFHVLVRKPR